MAQSPQAALGMFQIEISEWQRVLVEIGDRRYPGLGVCPPLYVYDQERPSGWPAHGTLLRVAGLSKDKIGWSMLIDATTDRKALTPTQAANLTWQTRRNNSTEPMVVPLTEDECHRATRLREQEQPETTGFVARKCWRPLLEWRPLSSGGWGYVEVGRYSVWQLI